MPHPPPLSIFGVLFGTGILTLVLVAVGWVCIKTVVDAAAEGEKRSKQEAEAGGGEEK